MCSFGPARGVVRPRSDELSHDPVGTASDEPGATPDGPTPGKRPEGTFVPRPGSAAG